MRKKLYVFGSVSPLTSDMTVAESSAMDSTADSYLPLKFGWGKLKIVMNVMLDVFIFIIGVPGMTISNCEDGYSKNKYSASKTKHS